MAANLVDGLTPEVVQGVPHAGARASEARRTSRRRCSAAWSRSTARCCPATARSIRTATYFVIGPDKQLAAYQDYLQAAVGKDATLYRLYPRDFWIPAKL